MPKKLTKEEFIKESKKVHGNLYNYDRVDYINNITKVQIICNIHGVFKQIPKDHKNGRGCWDCGKKKSVKKRAHTLEYFIKKSKKIHNDKYDYSLIKEYINNRQIVKIICKEHGNFNQRIEHHLNGLTGCIKCQQRKRINTCLDLYGEEYVQQLEEVKKKIEKTCLKKYGFKNILIKYHKWK